ncbi:hypothetical protein VKS41_007891 [Umbelopsis sp. WA50703]|jgi:hypothetical protein
MITGFQTLVNYLDPEVNFGVYNEGSQTAGIGWYTIDKNMNYSCLAVHKQQQQQQQQQQPTPRSENNEDEDEDGNKLKSSLTGDGGFDLTLLMDIGVPMLPHVLSPFHILLYLPE